MQQLNILELQFQRQQEILVERCQVTSGTFRKLVTRPGMDVPRLTDGRFSELGALVARSACSHATGPKSEKRVVRGRSKLN